MQTRGAQLVPTPELVRTLEPPDCTLALDSLACSWVVTQRSTHLKRRAGFGPRKAETWREALAQAVELAWALSLHREGRPTAEVVAEVVQRLAAELEGLPSHPTRYPRVAQ